MGFPGLSLALNWAGSLPPTDNRIENLARFGFLPKPFAFDELLEKVRTLIQAEAPFSKKREGI